MDLNWFTTATFASLGNGTYNIKVRNAADSTCLTDYTSNPVIFNSVSCDFDTDGDGKSDLEEDLNMDANFNNDDTDGDLIPNYQDADDDNDGVNSIIETGAPNNGDGNGDGMPDDLQADIASTQDNNGDYRTLEVISDSCSNIAQFIIHPEAMVSEADPVFDYPYQLNAFKIPCAGTVNINLYYHNVADLGGFIYRKYGPLVPDAAVSVWYDFPATFTQDTIGGNIIGKISFQLTEMDNKAILQVLTA